MNDAAGALLAGRTAQRWLVTGAAGFIGSHLVETLLAAGQRVVGLDDFATGHRSNLDEVRMAVGAAAWSRFELIEGDIARDGVCESAVRGVDHVLHQAALGSVPRSIADPLRSFDANATGFARLLAAARGAGVGRVVYASSSSVYGDHPDLPKREDRTGRVLSPYAATKAIDEVIADGFCAVYPLQCVGLRYFNVFGTRQDPEGAYAAVIPTWAAALLRGDPLDINGDGLSSRDFCYVANAVQANLRAALVASLPRSHEVFNVAVGAQTSLLDLARAVHRALERSLGRELALQLSHRAFRAGDVRHSLADIGKARTLLGYAPTHTLAAGLEQAMPWYVGRIGGATATG